MRSIIFCITCRYSAEAPQGPGGLTGGEMLAQAMEDLIAERGRKDVCVGRQACLWSCTRHCNVLISDSERYSYLAGGFVPGRDSAEAILAWFDLHGASANGEVPFRTWPQAMRGHFIARIPPFKP
jgi:predicted metal-binding protein